MPQSAADVQHALFLDEAQGELVPAKLPWATARLDVGITAFARHGPGVLQQTRRLFRHAYQFRWRQGAIGRRIAAQSARGDDFEHAFMKPIMLRETGPDTFLCGLGLRAAGSLRRNGTPQGDAPR